MERGRRRRLSGRRGDRRGTRAATIVEYALVLAALVVGLTGVIRTLEDGTKQEVANEFDCVSERPPPPSCQRRAVVVTTTTEALPPTSSTLPVETTTTTSEPEPTTTTTTTSTTTTTTTVPTSTATTATWSGLYRLGWDGTYGIFGRVVLLDADGQPVVGRQLTLVARRDGEVVGTQTCTTAGGSTPGRCTVVMWVHGGAPVDLEVSAVAGTPTLDPPPQTSGPV